MPEQLIAIHPSKFKMVKGTGFMDPHIYNYTSLRANIRKYDQYLYHTEHKILIGREPLNLHGMVQLLKTFDIRSVAKKLAKEHGIEIKAVISHDAFESTEWKPKKTKKSEKPKPKPEQSKLEKELLEVEEEPKEELPLEKLDLEQPVKKPPGYGMFPVEEIEAMDLGYKKNRDLYEREKARLRRDKDALQKENERHRREFEKLRREKQKLTK